MAEVLASPNAPRLEILDSTTRDFVSPSKRIHGGADVSFFLTSKAYRDVITFILQLNRALFPRKSASEVKTWTLEQHENGTKATNKLRAMLATMTKYLESAPPDEGPRRFGNASFRKWYQLVEENADSLLTEHLEVPGSQSLSDYTGPLQELKAYLLGAFGSAQRLDYGTGHELSFIAFLGAVWKVGGFGGTNEDGALERAIVLDVFEPYLQLIRILIKTYTLEPAGSHGVWGLDDHSFLPYLFGSAQLSPAITNDFDIPAEGSLPDAPDPGDVAKKPVVDRERHSNLYFEAIGFIYDVKKGPFWEHSPMLYDISGVQAGWAKINKGMIKMYVAEVLSKFPVVQHFPFGTIFAWEHDLDATAVSTTTHTANTPSQKSSENAGSSVGTVAPWAKTSTTTPLRDPLTGTRPQPRPAPGPMPPTRAPWAK